MTNGYGGGCQCGAIRYTIAGDLPPAYACHCGECKKQSGSAFGLSIPIIWSRFEVEGQVASSKGLTFGGKPKLRCFCPSCGNRMWHRSSEDSAWVTLKAGTLDNAAQISPRGHLWISKKQPWIVIDPALPAYDTQPDDVQAWRMALT
jgi:hypothetical protein